ncbi:3-keto-disaccharide hydrolase [Pseudomaricurvus sp.]|uniref:3-keto-disaccharide hydrolase n=1 Tax=Pseudomaricurvus sp. TaxID=2004510 RepID=UPI003F6D4CC4
MFNKFIPWGIASLLCVVLLGCTSMGSQDEWVTLFETNGSLNNFTTVGDADWVVTDQGVEAQEKKQQYAFLMTKNSYKDFELHVEFWVSDDANSGIYMRCQDAEAPKDTTCYEANIFDQRPDQSYSTGGIVHLAAVPSPAPKAGGRWNTYDITMQGTHLVVKLNGETTVDVKDSQFREGYIGLQWGSGTIRFREVKIKTL